MKIHLVQTQWIHATYLNKAKNSINNPEIFLGDQGKPWRRHSNQIQASSFWTTSPETSVSLKSRPWNR